MSRISRITLYCSLSTLLSVAVVVNAFEARPNFFAAAVYLSQSPACLMVLTNMFLVFTLISGKILQHLFFGRLRAIEVDHLYERAWYAVTETCLAMTIFREEFDTSFFIFFTFLITIKIFHWLAQDRVDYMEQTVEVPRSFHVRMTSIIGLLWVSDLLLTEYCLNKVFAKGPNVMIMFCFEFAILACTIAAVAGKYVLNLIEARQTETWDNKSLYIFYLELSTDFIKLTMYVAFFGTIMTFYGFPLHIIRDLYVTLRSFTTKCRNFMRFRKATQDMDARYPNATIEELDAIGDKTCIVCREDMLHATQPDVEGEAARTALDNPKKLPCGHILHFRCLRSWLERQQSCPMCRRPVLGDNTPPSVARPHEDAAGPNPPPPAPAPVPQADQAVQPNLPVGDGTNQGPPHANQPNVPRLQLPPQHGLDPIQLPRNFRLPPGWALLPVASADGPLPGLTSQTRHTSSATPAVATGTSPVDPGTALPPVIPLFGPAVGGGPPVVTLPPQLTEEQISSMEVSTRRTIEERLRILGELQARITESFSMLTRLQSIPAPAAEVPLETSGAEHTPTQSTEVQTDTPTEIAFSEDIDPEVSESIATSPEAEDPEDRPTSQPDEAEINPTI